jgi:hypothetical protein
MSDQDLSQDAALPNDTPTSGSSDFPIGPPELQAPAIPPPNQPMPNLDGTTATPVLAPQPGHMWQSLVTGALKGLAQGGIPGMLVGGVKGAVNNTSAAITSRDRGPNPPPTTPPFTFRDAQSASLVAQATNHDGKVSQLPPDLQKSANDGAQDTIDWLASKQIFPSLVTSNTHDGVVSGLSQITDRDGSVGPFAILNTGTHVTGFDIQDAMSKPGGLSALNEANIITGAPQLDREGLDSLPQPTVIKMFHDSVALLNKVPGTAAEAITLNEQAKNFQATAQANPGTPDDVQERIDDRVKQTQGYLDHYQGNAVDQAGRLEQQKADTVKQQSDASRRAGTSPVFAVDKTGQTVLSTQDQAAAQGLSAVRKVSQADIQKATNENNTLEAVTRQMNGVTDTATALDQGEGQRAIISQALASDEFKLGAHAAGASIEVPTQWISNYFKTGNQSAATPQTIAYVTAILNLREAGMGMNRIITGSARSSETQIAALQNTLPGFEANSGIVHTKLAKFAQDVDSFRSSVPRIPGNPRTALRSAPQAGTGLTQP